LVPNCSCTTEHRGAALLRIDYRGQRIELGFHQGGCVLGGVAAIRDHYHEGLADMAYLVGCEQSLLGIEDAVAHGRAPFARQRDLMIGDGRQQARKLSPAQDEGNAGYGRGPRHSE
jgi:hypothetical protein